MYVVSLHQFMIANVHLIFLFGLFVNDTTT